LNPYSKEN